MITFKVYCVEYNVLLKLISSISCHFLNFLIYLFLAVLGLRCWAQAFSGCGTRSPYTPMKTSTHSPQPETTQGREDPVQPKISK